MHLLLEFRVIREETPFTKLCQNAREDFYLAYIFRSFPERNWCTAKIFKCVKFIYPIYYHILVSSCNSILIPFFSKPYFYVQTYWSLAYLYPSPVILCHSLNSDIILSLFGYNDFRFLFLGSQSNIKWHWMTGGEKGQKVKCLDYSDS